MANPEALHPISMDPIGNDYKKWKQYHEEAGTEAYRWRRLYEAAASELMILRHYAELNDINLPGPGDNYT